MLARVRRNQETRDSGFTLIELLTVIVIIGILSGIAIPVFLNQRNKAVTASLIADIREMSQIQETYIVDHPHTRGVDFAYRVGGASANPGALPMHTSEKNSLTVLVGADGYCIAAWNPDSKDHATEATALKYDSGAGGLRKNGAACV